MKKSISLVVAAVVVSGCSTLYDLGGIAKRSNDPKTLKQDISFDATSRDLAKVKKMAWAGFTVSFACESTCPFTTAEQTTLAREIAETSFQVFDREIRDSLKTFPQLSVMPVAETVKAAGFATEIKNESFKTTVSRWLTRLGIGKQNDTVAAAAGLKVINPTELGWSGEESLAGLGRSLGVDGVLVGHIEVQPEKGSNKMLVVKGPKIWLFSANANKSLAVAGIKPGWKLEVTDASSLAAHAANKPALGWNGLDQVAARFSSRIAEGLKQ